MKRFVPIILCLMMILSGCGPGCNPVVGTDGDVQNIDLSGSATISTDQIPGLNPDGTLIVEGPPDIPLPAVEPPEAVPDKLSFREQH
jgi:hypothetical protein